MRSTVSALVLVTLALAAPARGAAAEAEPLLPPVPPSRLLTMVGAPVPPARSFQSGFVVEAGDGYKVGVETFGSAVILTVFRGHRGYLTETGYLAKGVAAPERLQATFGKFGQVRMRFREARNRPWFGRHRVCHGAQRFVKRRGVFVGNLHFRGEDGYVSVRAHRAKGAIVTVAAKCLHHHRARPPLRAKMASLILEPITALLASSRDGVDMAGFLALAYKGKMISMAVSEESRGKLAIVRIALAGKRGSLPTNEAVTAAHVTPPAPFHGTGRYRAAPDGTSTWSGDLSVNFPGAPRYPLTGPQFDVFLEVPF
jgi:hypothetical protein